MKRVLFLLCVQVLGLTSAGASDAAQNAGKTPPLEPPVALSTAPSPAPSSGTMSPLPAEDAPLFASPTRLDRIGRIMAPVTINGQGPFRLVVDTGASDSTISPKLAQALGIEPAQGLSILVNGVTGSAQLPSAVLQRIEAGSLLIENAHVPIIWSSIMADADGILGVAGLHKERVLVDFEHDRVVISHSRGRGPTMGYYKIPARRLPGGLMVVSARVGGIRADAVIDTGSERTLGNSALRQALHDRALRRGKVKDPVMTSVYGATADITDGEVQAAPVIELASISVSDVGVVYGDFHIFQVWNLERRPALILGMDVLGTVRAIEIDFAESELYVDTAHRLPTAPRLTRQY